MTNVADTNNSLKAIAVGLAKAVAYGVVDYSDGVSMLSRSVYAACPSLTAPAILKLEDEMNCYYADQVESAFENDKVIDASVLNPEIMNCMALVLGMLKGSGWVAIMSEEMTISTTIPYEQNVLRISAGRNVTDDGWELCVDDLGTTARGAAREAKFFRNASKEKVLSMLHYTLRDSCISISKSGTLSASFPIDENNMNSVVEAFSKIKVVMHGFLDAKQNCLEALEVVGVVKPTTISFDVVQDDVESLKP